MLIDLSHLTMQKPGYFVTANTFINVNNQALKEWFHQYAKAIITLERGHPPEQLEKFQKLYTTPMSKHTYDCRYIKG